MSVGVNVTESVCPAPTGSTVPAAGVYTNVPATLAVAFNCVPLSAVPKVMLAGAAHVIVGVVFPVPAATISTAAKFHLSAVGAVSLSWTSVPALATGPMRFCTQYVLEAPVSTH